MFHLLTCFLVSWGGTGMRYLDLAGGTGDISFRILEALEAEGKRVVQNYGTRTDKCSEVILSDINPSMLAVAKVFLSTRFVSLSLTDICFAGASNCIGIHGSLGPKADPDGS